jgi:16S rRNA (guanine527-N7)-methyltransferase
VSPRRQPLPPRVQGPPSSSPEPPAGRAPLPTDAATLAPLPDAFHETLLRGLGELRLDLSSTQIQALDAHVRLLLAWTEAINLTAIRDPVAVARDHLLDSLTAVPVLREIGAERMVDLGSGGGLPGIPLAVALPASRVLLVESIGKKARFLETAVAALQLQDRVGVAAERAEALAIPGRERDAADAVTIRAVGPLAELIELAFPLLRVGGRLIAWKREPLHEELAAGRNAARALAGEISVLPVTLTDMTDRRLIVVTKTRPTARRFPRPPAERRAHPL